MSACACSRKTKPALPGFDVPEAPPYNEMVEPRYNPSPEPEKPKIDYNQYATKKSIAAGLIDLTLLSHSFARLYSLPTNTKDPLLVTQKVIIYATLFLQITQAIVLAILGSYLNITNAKDKSKAKMLNNASLIIMLLIVLGEGAIEAINWKSG